MKQMSLADFIGMFARLRRANSRQGHWPDAVKKQAPHKPLLLLAVLDLVQRGVITTPFIAVSGDLVELNELFNLYWRQIIPLGQTSSIAFPFSRLSPEPFWELVPQPGKRVKALLAADQGGKIGLKPSRKDFAVDRPLSADSGVSAYPFDFLISTNLPQVPSTSGRRWPKAG
jgi:putative restriction endonuclease